MCVCKHECVLTRQCVGAVTDQEEVVVLRLCPEVLEDGLLPKPLHQVPVLHNAVADRPLAKKHIYVVLLQNVAVVLGKYS